jgi:hypothetical protein
MPYEDVVKLVEASDTQQTTTTIAARTV